MKTETHLFRISLLVCWREVTLCHWLCPGRQTFLHNSNNNWGRIWELDQILFASFFSFISLCVCTAKGIGRSGRVKLFLDPTEDLVLSLKNTCLLSFKIIQAITKVNKSCYSKYDLLLLNFCLVECNCTCKRMSFITKENNFLIFSIFQYIIQYALLFYINIYQPFGTDACTVAHCLKCDACHRIPNSSVQRVAAGESPAYFNVFPKGFCQKSGALTQQLGINYIALQMGTKGREIFSRDSLQSYTVKLFLSLDFFFFFLVWIFFMYLLVLEDSVQLSN